MPNYRVVAKSIYIERDQRLKLVNFEGLLELRAWFEANGVSYTYPSPSTFISGSQGQTIDLNKEITTVVNPSSIQVKVELYELEPGGGQGATDYGVATGTLDVLAGPNEAVADLRVTLSADSGKERSGTLVVRFAATKVGVPPPAQAIYKVYAKSLYVAKDQRTGTINFEGALELRARFEANSVPLIYPSPASYFSANQGDMISLGLEIATVQNLSAIPIKVEFWELEFGGQGGTDYGSIGGSIGVQSAPATATADLTTTISADNKKERSGTIVVTFEAVKQ